METIFTLFKWIYKKIVDFLINMKLEKEKGRIASKEYLNKVRIEAEFQAYKELSKTFADMVHGVSKLIPHGLNSTRYRNLGDQKRRLQENFNVLANAIITARNSLHANLAFIPESLVVRYEKILDDCNSQLHIFMWCFEKERWEPLEREPILMHFNREDYERTKHIENDFRQLSLDIRAL